MYKSNFNYYPNQKKENQKRLLEDKEHLFSWLNYDSLDYYRHSLMKNFLKKVINEFPETKFLTIGDGRFGLDANFLLKNGAKHVHASDIDDTLLKIAAEKKIINSFSKQNSEMLFFEDNSYDFILCKESLHHFPRPYKALEEMMRVSKKAVFLIEPRDNFIDRGRFQFILDIIKKICFKKTPNHQYEPSGNYLYKFSEREFEKFLLAVNLNKIGFISHNDVYLKGMEFVKKNSKKISDLSIISKFFFKKFILDMLTKLGFTKSVLITAALIKDSSELTLKKLKVSGFKIHNLPENSNPYLINF